MAREKLKDFLRNDPYGAATTTEKIDYIIDQGGDSSSDPYADDLKGDLKEALGRWSNYNTSTAPDDNQYTISDQSAEFSLRNEDGSPAHYTSGDGGEDKRYLSDGTGSPATNENPDAANYFATVSGGGTSDLRGGGTFSKEQLDSIIDKSGVDQEKSGHDILVRAAMDESRLISPVLAKGNRFDPGGQTPYIGPGIRSSKDIDKLKFSSRQGGLGKYNENSKAVALKDMKFIAEKMLVLATGHKIDNGFSVSAFGKELGGGTGLKAGLLPSLAQLGSSKVDKSNMVVENVAKPGFGGSDYPIEEGIEYGETLRDDGIVEAGKKFFTRIPMDEGGYRDKSYGTLNSPLEPFSAVPRMGMTTLTIALVLVIQILVDIVAAIISMLIAPVPTTRMSEWMGEATGAVRSWMGTSGPPPATVLLKPSFFGVTFNQNGSVGGQTFDEAVSIGSQVFFGEVSIRPESGGLLSFLPGGANINDSPGFYSIIFRSVVRSTIELGLTIGDAFKGGFFAVLAGIAKVLDAIRNSKLIAYLNCLADLGVIYTDVLEDINIGNLVTGGEGGTNTISGAKLSTLDAAILTPGTAELRTGKSFYGPKRGDVDEDGYPDDELVWGTGQLPSAYLFNRTVRGIYKTVGGNEDSRVWVPNHWVTKGFKESFKLVDNKFDGSQPYNKVHDVSESRLSAEVVKATEDYLDGEYVPFYFHDLRTNEIIAFNAFLTSLTDSYSATYDSTQGYGRADPVMTYNSTKRNIGLTFMCVSTNQNDFDEMWWKINMLTNMVYPQYSKGNQLILGDDSGTITSPFSQIPTASPVIRLRLGDIIKSNYSKFALARLFGLENHKDFAEVDACASPNEVAATYSDLVTPPLFGENTLRFESLQPVRVVIENKNGYKRTTTIPGGVMLETTDNEIMSLDVMKKAMAAGGLLDIGKYGEASVKVTGAAPKKGLQRIDMWGASAAAGVFNVWQEFLGREENLKIPYSMLFKKGLFKLNLPDTDPETDAGSGTDDAQVGF